MSLAYMQNELIIQCGLTNDPQQNQTVAPPITVFVTPHSCMTGSPQPYVYKRVDISQT